MSEERHMDADEAKTAMQLTVETFRKDMKKVVEDVQWTVEVLPDPAYQQHLREEELNGWYPEPLEYGDDPEWHDRATAHYYELKERYTNEPLPRTVAELDNPIPMIQGSKDLEQRALANEVANRIAEERIKAGYRDYAELGYDGPDDVRRPRDLDPVPGYGAALSQLEQSRRREEARELRELRSEGRLFGAQDRIAKRLAAKQQPQQEQGYGRSY